MDDKGPIELRQDDSNRRYIYLAFLALTLTIFPLWLLTTSVPRNSCTIPSYFDTLPLRFTRLTKVQLVLINSEESEWHHFDDTTIAPLSQLDEKVIAFDDEFDLKAFKLNFPIDEQKLLDKNYLLSEVGKKISPLNEDYIRVILIPTGEKPSVLLNQTNKTMMVTGCQTHVNFWEPQVFLEDLFSAFIAATSPISPVITHSDSHLLPVASKYRVTFTLLVAQPKDNGNYNKLWEWDVEEAFDKYLKPLVNEHRSIADFSISFQTKAHIDLDLDPIPYSTTNNETVFVVPDEFIPTFVNENSWNMAKSIDSGTPIEFAIIIPPSNIHPLYLESRNDGARNQQERLTECFAYRQWGSVCILNKTPIDTNRLKSKYLKESFAFFAGHLRHLFPATINDSLFNGFTIEKVKTNSIYGISSFEKEALKRQIIQRRLSIAVETLSALRRLFAKNKEIPILPKPASLIKLSIKAITDSKSALSQSNIEKALLESYLAADLAELAFFDPSMMAHQYFPEDHKLGVYMPLFFPFILPIVMASAALLRKHVQEKRAAAISKNKTE